MTETTTIPPGAPLEQLRDQALQAINGMVETIDLPLAVVVAIVNPRAAPPWREVNDALSPEQFEDLVLAALATGDLCAEPWDRGEDTNRLSWVSPQRHAARIAWFVENGWQDAITISAWSQDTAEYPLSDGNHRLYAAILREETTLQVGFDGPTESMASLVSEAFSAVLAESGGSGLPTTGPAQIPGP